MEEYDKERVQWLRSSYQEVPFSSSTPKRVKVSDVHQQFEERFREKCSHQRMADLIQQAFPHAETKISRTARTNHVFGIWPVSNPCEAETRESSVPQVTELLQSEPAETLQLKQKIALLEARVQELERNTPVFLGQQADMLVDKRSSLTVCGPDSYEHLTGFLY